MIYREISLVSPVGNVIDILFALRQKYKDENNEVMQILVKFFLNSVDGEQIRRDIEKNFACKSEYSMFSEYDEQIKEYWKISHSIYIVKMTDDAGMEDEVKKIYTMPLHLGVSVLINSKRFVNKKLKKQNP